jgi:hypothetical protein
MYFTVLGILIGYNIHNDDIFIQLQAEKGFLV